MKRTIAWMAKNSVAANLAMMVIVVGGFLFGRSVNQEVFPSIELDSITVSVSYPGASPLDVEQGVCLPVEEAIAGIEGIKEITCVANEGVGGVTAELLLGEDIDQILQDIKSEVDRIRTFPLEAEDPDISAVVVRREVLSIAVYGDLEERALRESAEQIRDDLLEHHRVTQVDLSGVRPYEISIEIDETTLRKFGLTLDDISRRVRESSIDVPGGVVKTSGGHVLLRTQERKYTGREYGEITVVSLPDGTEVKLSDVATVKDDFREEDQSGLFDGKPAALVRVYRVGDQSPIELSQIVKQYIKKKEKDLPSSLNLTIWNDKSEIFESRLRLLLKNAYLGLTLVLLVLGLFLEIKLAFWVTLGIPISFLGALFIMPMVGATINMISLFAFILSLGIVVDDAIVVGENIYEHSKRGANRVQAAIKGTQEVAGAVVFSILTSVAAFMPLLFVTGMMGKFMGVIPVIVISALLVSLFESLFILPAHLAHSKPSASKNVFFAGLEKRRQEFNQTLEGFINTRFRTFVGKAVRARYVTLSASVSLLIVSLGLVAGGYLKLVHMPEIEGDVVSANLVMPVGTPVEETTAIRDTIMRKAEVLVREFEEKNDEPLLRNIYSITGDRLVLGGHGGPSQPGGSHLASIAVFLLPSDERNTSSLEFEKVWRSSVGEIAGVESLTFKSTLIGMGDAIDLQLSHDNYEILRKVADRVKQSLRSFEGVGDVSDNFSSGKRELKFKLKPEARTLGVTEAELGRQVRAAFYGSEALRFQRGRDELKVMVRYPEGDRTSLGDIDSLRIRTANGGEIAFNQVAFLEDSRGHSQIRRSMRKRVVNVRAAVDMSKANPKEILFSLSESTLPQLLADYPGLSLSLEGEERERGESTASLRRGYLFALFLIYVLLAIPFKSYIQPLIVMSAIPFGLIGALFGHLIVGYDVSLLSMCGLVALSGVVVNDSLILVDYINSRRLKGDKLTEAVLEGAVRRFRPILLTSLTTFFGLVPIILETSVQAQFLIPMAISLGFGVLFATLITLVLIPSLYLIIEDFRSLIQRLTGGGFGGDSADDLDESPVDYRQLAES